MKSNDILLEYTIGDKFRSGIRNIKNKFRVSGVDYTPQDPEGLNKGDPKFGYPETPIEEPKPRTTLPKSSLGGAFSSNSSIREKQVAKKYFVENFVETIYTLVAGELEAENSYIARPKTSPSASQVSLDEYLHNWYYQYIRRLQSGAPENAFRNFVEEILNAMQDNWNKGEFDTKLLADLGGSTYSYMQQVGVGSSRKGRKDRIFGQEPEQTEPMSDVEEPSSPPPVADSQTPGRMIDPKTGRFIKGNQSGRQYAESYISLDRILESIIENNGETSKRVKKLKKISEK